MASQYISRGVIIPLVGIRLAWCVHTLFPAIIPENIVAIISVAWAVGAIVYDHRLMMNVMNVDMAVARRNLQSHYGGWKFRRPAAGE